MTESNKPFKVLLVEDTEDNRFMMRRLLEMTGYRVIEAMNGEEAVQLAATRLIRKLPDFEATPIIAVSAHDTSDFQSEAIQAGCNRYITKPIDFNELEALIAELLTQK